MSDFVEQYIECLEGLGFWRLFVDGYRQRASFASQNNLGEFEEFHLGHFLWATREPSGLNILRESAKKLFGEALCEDVTFEFLEELHQLSYPFEDHLRLAKGYLKDGQRYFGYIEDVSEKEWIDARAEALKELCCSDDVPWKVVRKEGEGFEVKADIWSYETKVRNYNIIYEKYCSDLESATSEHGKLEVIAQYIQDIECMHFFTDGNCRMIYLLLNKELLKNNLKPTILFDPNMFDRMSQDNLVNEIIEGQNAFELFYKTGKPYDDSISDDEIAINIAKVDESDFKIFGDSELSFSQNLEFISRSKPLINKFVEIIKIKHDIVKSKEKLNEYWAAIIKTHVVYEYFQKFHKGDEYTKLTCCDVLTKVDFNGISYELYKSGLVDQAELEDILFFLEYMNFNHIMDFVYDNNPLLKDDFEIEEVLELILDYINLMEVTCKKYMEEFTIESLSDPQRCHLTFAEQQVTEEIEIGKKDLISDVNCVVGFEIETEYTETDVIGSCEHGD